MKPPGRPLKLWNWIDIMKAWLIYTDTRKYKYLQWGVEAVVTYQSRDLVCHSCGNSFYCEHVAHVLNHTAGYASPFVEEIEVRDEMQAVDTEFQRRFIEARSRTLDREAVSTNFIEL
jgi:hypothetical protein